MSDADTQTLTPTSATLDGWANDLRGPAALHLRQALLPVEGRGAVIFPPTFAEDKEAGRGAGYCIDTLSDGTRVALIDSVGSQANRIEPLFMKARPGRPANPLAELVPQVDIAIGDQRTVSILEAGHRLGDALVRCSELGEAAHAAFRLYQDHGDASAIARLSPTSLVFGAWDSRDTQAKLPRIVQSVVRAWDVTPLRRAAQYVPPVDYAKLDIFSEEEKRKAEGNTTSDLARRGFVHVPSGAPGGIVARGDITRDVTVNLVALRQLGGEDGAALRRYILGLALVAACEDQDGFLRQGCLLTPDPDVPAAWTLVHRNGRREPVALTADMALACARTAAAAFGVAAPRTCAFLKERAKADIKAKA